MNLNTPNPADIELTKAEIVHFANEANQTKTNILCHFDPISKWPIRFEIWFEDDGTTVIVNDLFTHELWRGRGLCTHVLAALEGLPGVKRVGVFRPNSKMRSLVAKSGYQENYADNVWFKELSSDEKRGRSPLV